MSQSILIFDFKSNEESAQAAWHRLESWKKGFRLGNKLSAKFERTLEEPAAEEDAPKKSKKKSEAEEEETSHIRLLVRLAFSDHEKLSYTRWLDRIPTEEPFKSAKHEIQNQDDDGYDKAQELFDSLD
jgi:hypothetical protein